MTCIARLHCSLLVAGALLLSSAATAAPVNPIYTQTYSDCTTNGNQASVGGGKFGWTISGGCDSYQNELYERPTDQTYKVSGEIFAAEKYFANLDIEQAQAGVDDTFFYGSIDLVGRYEVTQDGTSTIKGLPYEYQILLSTQDPDGANGYWLSSLGADHLGTSWQLQKNEGNRDTDGSVGGPGGISVTKQDSLAELGNGFDLDVIGDGRLNTGAKPAVMWTRLDPFDNTIVQFAIDYKALGFQKSDLDEVILGNLGYLDFRAINGGPKDPQNYLWNDKYNKSEAGSPYRCGDTAEPCGDLTKSEFGTQGLGNLYLLDNLRATGSTTAVPEPSTLFLLSLGLAGAERARRRRTTSKL